MFYCFKFFLKINFFSKNLSVIATGSQTVWIQIRPAVSPFKMHKIIFFPENLKNFKVSPENLGRVRLP